MQRRAAGAAAGAWRLATAPVGGRRRPRPRDPGVRYFILPIRRHTRAVGSCVPATAIAAIENLKDTECWTDRGDRGAGLHVSYMYTSFGVV